MQNSSLAFAEGSHENVRRAVRTTPKPAVSSRSNVVRTPSTKAKRVTARKANTKGAVLVLEYHHVLAEEGRWARSTKNFRADLERLYKLGYRPVTLAEYLENRIKIAPGASPVVITFDDSHPNQFYILKDGRIDPNSAVGIWRDFAATHPDFPVKATWFVVPNMAFGQPRLFGKKLKMLQSWGSEIGSHTLSHGDLGKMTDDQVRKEIGGSIQKLKSFGVEVKTLAFPYGVPPKNRVLAKELIWNGTRYKLNGAVLAGSGPARAPTDQKLRRFSIPRIQAIGGDYGITYWLNKAKAGEYKLYVAP